MPYAWNRQKTLVWEYVVPWPPLKRSLKDSTRMGALAVFIILSIWSPLSTWPLSGISASCCPGCEKEAADAGSEIKHNRGTLLWPSVTGDSGSDAYSSDGCAAVVSVKTKKIMFVHILHILKFCMKKNVVVSELWKNLWKPWSSAVWTLKPSCWWNPCRTSQQQTAF